MNQERIVVTIIKNGKVLADITRDNKNIEILESYSSNGCELKERKVSYDFYQELVDEGGKIYYSK